MKVLITYEIDSGCHLLPFGSSKEKSERERQNSDLISLLSYLLIYIILDT
jgi:hypothetical protein